MSSFSNVEKDSRIRIASDNSSIRKHNRIEGNIGREIEDNRGIVSFGARIRQMRQSELHEDIGRRAESDISSVQKASGQRETRHFGAITFDLEILQSRGVLCAWVEIQRRLDRKRIRVVGD